MIKFLTIMFLVGLVIATKPWIDVDSENKQIIIWYGRKNRKKYIIRW